MTAAAPTRIRVRSYNVGFGDCFLLSLFYATGDVRHVLIDFGSTMASRNGPETLLPVAEKIREHTGGKLHMVVATHRHADHISGFGKEPGAVIKSLEPERVLQPWTEDPELQPDATGPVDVRGDAPGNRALAARLSDMHAVAAGVLEQVPRLEESGLVTKTIANQLRFLGETNLKNEAAVKNLMTMGRKPPIYARFGTRLALARLLPGIQIDVLGPPTLRQSGAIAKQASSNADEFWQLAARRAVPVSAGNGRIFPRAAVARRPPQEARWLIPQIAQMRAQEMLSIVRILDGVLNNTSLILLFHIGKRLLLFPGDAQIENWSYALFAAPDHEAIRARLAKADFYKVGHHGSRNATPKTLWNTFEHRAPAPAPGRLATMVSTLAGKHPGTPGKNTEVPRLALIEELNRMSDLRNTQTLRSKSEFWTDVELDA
ncbi:MAG: hypothetical protein M3540_00020 [Actinomycetota bacterium]|nr:hypothetical protein [Actinomycetota bacterium]